MGKSGEQKKETKNKGKVRQKNSDFLCYVIGVSKKILSLL